MRTLFMLGLMTLSLDIWGADIAYIVAEKAIIYSDIELTIPIGYAIRGKKIKVGEVARNNGQVLTTVVSGRITYIKRVDVELEKNLSEDGTITLSPQVQEHEVLLETHQFDDDFSKNNHLILLTGSGDSGSEWEELAQSDESGKLTQVGIGVEHRPPLRRYSWGLSLNYMSSDLNDYNFKTIFLEGRLQYSLMRFDWIAFDAVVGLNGSAEARLTNSAALEKSRGLFYGWLAGAQVRLFPFSQIGLIAGMEVKNYILHEMDNITATDGSSVSFKGFNGTQVWAALTWKL